MQIQRLCLFFARISEAEPLDIGSQAEPRNQLNVYRIGGRGKRKRKVGQSEAYSQLASNLKTVPSFLKSVFEGV
jgi:hypothetical protein